MTDKTTQSASPEFIAVFRQEAGAGGLMSFARFMDLALFHPAVGYYARPQQRIGRAPATDFFTAASLGPIFGELVVASCVDLLGPRPPGAYTFVEIGAEPDGAGSAALGGVLAGVSHPFAGTVSIPLGQALVFPPRSVVFSNELFDAQPFHRLVRESGRWRETGVALRQDILVEILLPELSPGLRTVQDRLPPFAPDGYRIDLPLAAGGLAAQIAGLPWSGLFVAFDYGKSWRELAEATPGGTLRAYFRHRQGGDLLAQAGCQDLTGHVCWDWLADELVHHGFGAPALESQEAFFVHHATPALSRLTVAEAGRFSGRKLSVLQLLHPDNMGRKFQVLHALRDSAS
jgi:SAM-dependent MidA family methyltransferase